MSPRLEACSSTGMRFVHLVIAAAVSAVTIACTSSVTDPSSSPPESHGPPCEATAEGQGVKITIRSASCDYDYGSTATFDYDLTVDATAPPIEVAASTSCGSCRRFSTDPASWTSWSVAGKSAAGVQQVTCSSCAVGCCSPDPAGTYQLDVGTSHGSFVWSGRTTGGIGPDDGVLPEGPFFDPGTYEAAVGLAHLATVKLPFVIRARD